MLNAHELYVLAESPDLRATPSSGKQRTPRHRTRSATGGKIEMTARSNQLSIDHVAILGEN